MKYFYLLTFLSLCLSCSGNLNKKPLNNSAQNSSQADVKDALKQDANSTQMQAKKVSDQEKDAEKLIEEKKKDKITIPRKYTRVKNTKPVEEFCDKTQRKFAHWGWGLSRCKSFHWHHVRDSYLGDPLMWVTFGSEEKLNQLGDQAVNVTMILCGVHGDEITPVKFCYDILHYLYQLQGNETEDKNFKNKLIVIAPIANPDSFFRARPTRTNYRGVDINRNFPTKDWDEKALKLWKSRYRSDKRRYPGEKALSEQETYFQVNLIKRYRPNRIISVHAPLTILDYDGPTLSTKPLPDHNHEVAMNAMHLLVQMSKKAKDYRIKNYPFFPGSLGNYAGNERHIPTYTLELPSSDNRKHKEYWKMFKTSIDYALFHTAQKDKVVSNKSAKDKNKSSN